MSKAVKIPQGLYLVGRDIPIGIYSIKMCNDETTIVTHTHRDADSDWTNDQYWLIKSNMECRISVEKEDRLKFDGAVIMERIVNPMIQFD